MLLRHMVTNQAPFNVGRLIHSRQILEQVLILWIFHYHLGLAMRGVGPVVADRSDLCVEIVDAGHKIMSVDIDMHPSSRLFHSKPVKAGQRAKTHDTV